MAHPVPDLIAKVGGVWAGQDLQNEFQREVAEMLKRNNPRVFPGAQPVSFAKKHLDELKTQDYFVCEKTDGLRVLLYLTDDGQNPPVTPVAYLIDRRNDYYWVDRLRFPHHENNPTYSRFHTRTLLDGELVEDRHPDGRTTIKFLAFDCLVCDNKDMRERPLDKRLAYLKAYILKPYTAWLKDFPAQASQQAFIFDDKKTEFAYSLQRMFEEIIPQVKKLHDQHILKWKPPHDNTVDFLMHIEWATIKPDLGDPDQSLQHDYDSLPAGIGLYIYHGRNMDYSYVADLYLTSAEWDGLKLRGVPLQDAIVECFLEDTTTSDGSSSKEQPDGPAHIKRWRLYRMRDDKDEANHISTFESVIDSIQDHITEQDLLNHADAIRAAWKARDARKSSRPPQ
ncbi:Dcp1p-Dcp2p decapping enzyme complex alpha subunit [Lithohypha guttulata]|uniref:mRNA guanylyltransferase n=1 Tax=Lithohypha guttulata TaxID=1690604 RepID=A0AAN7YEZ4_9EURO|nr:Dcp1p-Dcp2p decapping enzyme complex alpha subunit [Lithohypha guttulata]